MDKNKTINTKKKKKNFPSHLKLRPLYYILAFVRVVLALAPEPGYIHPDEYMQSVEVVTGAILDVEYTKVWEFNPSFPVRSITPPYVMVGLPIFIFKTISNWLEYDPHISPHFLVILSRVVCCFLSFLVDYSLYKICCLYDEDVRKKTVVLSCSYVMMTYAIRTFTNSTEMVLMSLLLYYVSKSILLTKKNLEKREEILTILNDDRTYVEIIHYKRILKKLGDSTYESCGIISFILVVGIFNRPSFIAYAFAPVFFWLTRGLRSRLVTLRHFHLRFIRFIVQSIPYATLFITVDSIYYGYTTFEEIIAMKTDLYTSFVVTPYNFLKYNSNSSNLIEHGLHPRYTHLLLNIPLLFNVLGLMFVGSVLSLIWKVCTRQWLELPSVESIKGLMLCSCVVPLVVLSAVPHQEPRFLIPLTLPIIFLFADTLLNKKSGRLIFIDWNIVMIVIVGIWCCTNVFLTFFYGFIHQAGILPVANHMSSVLANKERGTQIHFITSHVYQFPKSLLQVPRFDSIRYSKSSNVKYKRRADFFLYELGSSRSMQDVCQFVNRVTEKIKENKSSKGKVELYFLLPNSLREEFQTIALKTAIGYRTDRLFYPHVSTEALPRVSKPLYRGSTLPNMSWVGMILRKYVEQLGLSLYVIKT